MIEEAWESSPEEPLLVDGFDRRAAHSAPDSKTEDYERWSRQAQQAAAGGSRGIGREPILRLTADESKRSERALSRDASERYHRESHVQ
jgi:hypothetical protein